MSVHGLPVTENRFYKRDHATTTRMLGEDGALLFQADICREKRINSTGFFVWQQLDGSQTVNDIVAGIVDQFDAPFAEVVADVSEFLKELGEEGFLQPVDEKQIGTSQDFVFPDVSDAPSSLDISVTGKCNLHCAYCFYHDEMAARPDLEIGEWLTFFGEAGRLSVRDVTLSGGELFVRRDLFEMMDGLSENRMRFSINTNGTLITEKMLAAFEHGKRKKRLDSIQVSIDGSCAAVHDKSRGKGSFVKAIRGLRLLKEAQFPVTVRVTVNRHNVHDLHNVAKLLLDDIGLHGFGTNDAMPMGAGCANQPDISLTPRQQVQAMHSLAGLAETYNDRINATAGPLAKWRSYQAMEHARATGEKTSRWRMGYLTACGCMFNKLSVHHDGIITPCNMLAKLEMGRINRDSLSDVWRNHQILKDLKDRRKIPMSQVPGCEECEWNEYCNGSCPGLAYEMTGNVNRANPHDCYRDFLRATGGLDFQKK